MLPWYERDATGRWTGREWDAEAEARRTASPDCTVHEETSSRVGHLTRFDHGRFTRWVIDVVRHPWKPPGFGGTG